MTKHCDNCDEPVSDAFHRVHSDNEGILYSCPECAAATAEHGRPPEERRQRYSYSGDDLRGDWAR